MMLLVVGAMTGTARVAQGPVSTPARARSPARPRVRPAALPACSHYAPAPGACHHPATPRNPAPGRGLSSWLWVLRPSALAVRRWLACGHRGRGRSSPAPRAVPLRGHAQEVTRRWSGLGRSEKRGVPGMALRVELGERLGIDWFPCGGEERRDAIGLGSPRRMPRQAPPATASHITALRRRTRFAPTWRPRVTGRPVDPPHPRRSGAAPKILLSRVTVVRTASWFHEGTVRPTTPDDINGAETTPLQCQRIAHGGSCGKTRVVAQNRRPRPEPAERGVATCVWCCRPRGAR